MKGLGRLASTLLLMALLVSISAKFDYRVVNTLRNTSSITLTLNYTGS